MLKKQSQIGLSLFLIGIGALIIGYDLLKNLNSSVSLFIASIFVLIGIALFLNSKKPLRLQTKIKV
ncbi:MAG: hypothetical protein K0B02_01225 [DPANN group archaeon]|nr:hypothetical protein [DPANN group archaeon]